MPFIKWLEKQLSYQRNKKGRYLHFDSAVKLVHRDGTPDEKRIAWFFGFFADAVLNIPKHSFYPFIKADIETPRIKHQKDPKTGKKRPVVEKKIRPIAYASHFDSLIYSWYSHELTEKYQASLKDWGIEDCVLAYLTKGSQCNIHYAHEIFRFINEKTNQKGECVALAFDLSSYFDGIDHEILKIQWCKVLKSQRLPKDHFKIFQSLTNYSFIQKEYLDIRFPKPLDKNTFTKRICEPWQFRAMVTDGNVIQKNPFCNKISGSKRSGQMCGIPQGSSISACLSNIYLIDFDRLINAFAKKKDARYRRYCDDLLIVCSKEDASFFERLILRATERCEVLLNEKKTEVIYFKKEGSKIYSKTGLDKPKHLQYLGFEFDGVNTYIRSASMSRYHRRLCSKASQAIDDAYCSEFGNGEKIHRKKLYIKFTHLSKRNFIRYGLSAMKIMDDSKTIKYQVKGSIEKVEKLLKNYKGEKEANLNKEKSVYKKMK